MKREKDAEGELWTMDELTSRLKISKNWVYQRIHARRLPFPYCKIGHFLRFPARGVEKYIDSQLRKERG